MTLSESQLDEYIQNKVARELEDIKVPDVDEQWLKFQKRLQSEEVDDKETFPSKRYRNITWAAVIFIVISSLLFKPTYAQAFGEKFMELFSVITGKSTHSQIESYQHSPSSDKPTVQDLSINIEKEVTLEEAQSMISFTLSLPNYLPEGSKAEKITVTFLGSNHEKVTIHYVFEGNSIIFEQSKLGSSASRGSLYDSDDTLAEEISIAGRPAVLFNHKSGLTKLNWESKSLLNQLTGKIPREELIKIAESIS
ncbi:MAG: DUF4367 domain-containing protein [Desulfitobacterium sp.]